MLFNVFYFLYNSFAFSNINACEIHLIHAVQGYCGCLNFQDSSGNCLKHILTKA